MNDTNSSTYTDYLTNPNGPGWPEEDNNTRRHRIAFFDRYKVTLRVQSTEPYNDQLRRQEDTMPKLYGNDVLTQTEYNLFFDMMKDLDQGKSDAEVCANRTVDRNKPSKLKEMYNLVREQIQGGPSNCHLVKKSAVKGQPHGRVFHSGNVFEALCSVHYVLQKHKGSAATKGEHVKLGHKISRDMIIHFISTCPTCSRSTSRPPTKPFVGAEKPIKSSSFRSRFQVDLIDMSRSPQPNQSGVMMRWIVTVKDHFSKFVMLDSIERKEAKLVAQSLSRLFGIVGYPTVLQSDNGGEFSGENLVALIKEFYPDCIMVHGRPRTPRVQGSVEQMNGLVKNELFHLQLHPLQRNQRFQTWVQLLPSINASLNDRHCPATGFSPYEHVYVSSYHQYLTAHNVVNFEKLTHVSNAVDLSLQMNNPELTKNLQSMRELEVTGPDCNVDFEDRLSGNATTLSDDDPFNDDNNVVDHLFDEAGTTQAHSCYDIPLPPGVTITTMHRGTLGDSNSPSIEVISSPSIQTPMDVFHFDLGGDLNVSGTAASTVASEPVSTRVELPLPVDHLIPPVRGVSGTAASNVASEPVSTRVEPPLPVDHLIPPVRGVSGTAASTVASMPVSTRVELTSL